MLNHATPGDVIRAIQRARAGQAFIGGHFVSGTGSQYTHIQLFNPGGSGVIVFVFSIVGNPDTAAHVQLRSHNTALTTLSAQRVNKNMGGAAPVCEVRHQTNASLLGTLITPSGPLPLDTPYRFLVGDPIVLGAGEGVLTVPGIVNVGSLGAYEWIEL